MKKKLLLFFSVIQLLLPIIIAYIMTFFEKEQIEAILSGLFIGWIINVFSGISLLIINRNYKISLVTITSILAIIPACILAPVFLMYILFI